MQVNKQSARKAPAPGSNIVRRRLWRIERTPAPTTSPATESDRGSERHESQARERRLLRQAEAARIAETQFKIRCERAVMVIARTGCDTRVACRSVGLHGGTKAEVTVKALCDARNIPRRYWWGVPHWNWKTQAPYPAIVKSRKQRGPSL
jgi:hypothetical protein